MARLDRLRSAVRAARLRARRAEILSGELYAAVEAGRAELGHARQQLEDAAAGRLRGVVRDMRPGPDVAAMLAMGVAIREVAQADVDTLRRVLADAEATEGAPLYGWRAWLDLLASQRGVAALALEELVGALNAPEGIELAASLSALHHRTAGKPAKRKKHRR